MSKGPWRVLASDVKRLVKTLRDLDLPIHAIRIGPDGVHVDTQPTGAGGAEPPGGRPNSFDQVLGER